MLCEILVYLRIYQSGVTGVYPKNDAAYVYIIILLMKEISVTDAW